MQYEAEELQAAVKQANQSADISREVILRLLNQNYEEQ